MNPLWTAVWRSARIKTSLSQSVCWFPEMLIDISWVHAIFFSSPFITLLEPGDCMQVFLYVWECESVLVVALVAPRLTESGALWENRRLLSSFMVYSTRSLLYRSFPPSLPHTWPLPHTNPQQCVCECERERESVWERYNSVCPPLACFLPFIARK